MRRLPGQHRGRGIVPASRRRLFANYSASYLAPTIPTPSPYHRRTWAASCSDFATKSEDALEEVRRRYDDGTKLTPGYPLHSRGNAESAYGAVRPPGPTLLGNLALGGFFLTFAATYFEG